MTNAGQIRLAKKEDADLITDLFIASSPRHLRTRDFWLWSNFDNPSGKSLSVVMEVEGKIVAHYAILPLRFNVGSDQILLGFGQQAVVHPNFRDLRTIINLTEFLWEKAGSMFELVYAFPNDHFWKVKKLLMGWQVVSEFKAYEASINALEKFERGPNVEIKRIHSFPKEIDSWLNESRNEKIY